MHDPTERFGGVDWATDGHAVAVVDPQGRIVGEFGVSHTADGLADLYLRLSMAKVRRVAIERPDGPVVDALLDAEFEVVVVSSRSVKALRSRYGTAGNKCDRSDAYVADCLRTDGHHWPSLEPDSPARVTLRSHVRARKDLVETRVAVANQLRAHLRVTSPAPSGCSVTDSSISLRFLERFPSATRAAWLSEKRLGAWLRANGYSGRKTPGRALHPTRPGRTRHRRRRRRHPRCCHSRLRRRPQEPARPDRQTRDAHRRGPGVPTHRPARPPVPRPRVARLPRRRRTFHPRLGPTPHRHLPVGRRKEAPRRPLRLRWRQLASQRLGPSPLPLAPRRRQTTPHAERIHARSWTHIIWRCWQDRTPYDPTRQGGHQPLTQQAA